MFNLERVMELGWLKKLMDYVLGYEVKEIVVKNGNEVTKRRQVSQNKKRPVTVKQQAVVKQHPVGQEQQNIREVQAKVTYRYPKGKFRFPLIPDEGLEAQHENNKKVGREAIKPVFVEKQNRSHYEQLTEKQTNYARQPVETKKKEAEHPKAKSKPFRPSEVPSPLYGFRKRATTEIKAVHKNVDSAIEFELPPPSIKILNSIKELAPIQEKKNAGNARADSRQEEILEGKESEEENEISFVQMKGLENRHEKNDVATSPLIVAKKEEPAAGEQAKEIVQLEVLEEEQTTEQNGASPLIETKEEGPATGEQAKEIVQLEMTEEEQDLEDNKKTSQAAKTEEQEASLPVNKQEKQPLEEKMVIQSHQAIQEPRPRRAHVPYNVMMLKKDREQLQKQKTTTQLPVSRGITGISTGDREEPDAPHKCSVLDSTKLASSEKKYRNNAFSEGEQTLPVLEGLTLEGMSSEWNTNRREGVYEFPSIELLNIPSQKVEDDYHWLEEQRQLLDVTLKNFNVRAKVVNVAQGPSVTRFEVQPEPGVKVNKITNLTDDIKLSLAARDIRIEAPIPGKNTIGIEVPNPTGKPVLIREILSSPAFMEQSSPLTVALGLDISGKPVVTDLNKMPHGLIAGATGSGKSVCINTIIVSLLYKAAPNQVKLMLIDPKMVELAPYNGIPHLVSPVITDAKAATAALKWAVEEMERRYELFAHTGVRDITKYNEKVSLNSEKSGELPYLVIIIDELADLMMVSPGEVEESICRIAQKARACGIHLLLATQRPSVDVITGLIKANIPTRVAFSVSSQVDSRTIIDTAGAEKLLGRGDMLLLENGSSKTVRIQGNFVTDEEIDAAVEHVKRQMKPNYLFEQKDLIQKQQNFSPEEDELFHEACEFILNQGGASTSSLQRHFRIGYNRAARLIDMMEEQGIISEAKGSKPRDVLITEDELLEMQNINTPL